MKRSVLLVLVLSLAAMMMFAACAKDETTPVGEIEPAEEVAPPPPPPPPIEEEEPQEVMEEDVEPVVLADVFFDFDKYNIKDRYRDVLAQNADMLMENPDVSLLIEGHCDERGTNEYNLALGEKRAKAVMDFYIAYGIDADRLSMISYGEERPFALGHNEEAWAKNRRAHMVVKE